MRFSTLFLAVPLVLTACLFTRDPHQVQNPDPNHIHVDFAVWINGMKWDFSDAKYMSEAPAAEGPLSFFPKAFAHAGEEEELHEDLSLIENPKRKYLHLHDGNGNVIHSHKPGQTLAQFFESIDWLLGHDCVVADTGQSYCSTAEGKRWRMFVNGAEVSYKPDIALVDLDQVLLTYGSDDAAIAKQLEQLTGDACLYSQRCPWRGEPPTENCIADPAVPCVE